MAYPDLTEAVVTVAASDTARFFKRDANYVCSGDSEDGGDEHIINLALSRHKTVLLLPGTFWIRSPIVLQSDRALVGSGVDVTTIKLIRDYPSEWVSIISGNELSNVTLRGFTVHGNANQNAMTTGIEIRNSSNVLIESVKITDVTEYGIRCPYSSYVTIDNCNIVNTAFRVNLGIYIHGYFESPASTVRVTRCRLSRCNDAVDLSAINNALIAQNIIDDTINIGILCYSCYSSVISGNIVRGAGMPISAQNGSSNIIVGNTVRECGFAGNLFGAYSPGITLYLERYSIVDGNTVFRSRGKGIHIEGCNDCLIINNTVVGASQASNNIYDNIFLTTSHYCSLFNNICRKGAFPNLPRYGIRINSGTNNVVVGNNLYDSGQSGDLSDVGTNTRKRSNIGLAGGWLPDS